MTLLIAAVYLLAIATLTGLFQLNISDRLSIAARQALSLQRSDSLLIVINVIEPVVQLPAATATGGTTPLFVIGKRVIAEITALLLAEISA